jgi:hypothetical protein
MNFGETDHQNIDLYGLQKSSKFLGRQKKRKMSAYLPYLLVSGEINAWLLVSYACSIKCFGLG